MEKLKTGRAIRDIIRKLEREYGNSVPTEEVVSYAKAEGINKERVEDIIFWMKRDGILFSPYEGEIQLVR